MSQYSQVVDSHDELDLRDAVPDDYPGGIRGYVQGIYGNGDHFNQVMIELQLQLAVVGMTLKEFGSKGSIESLDLLLDFIDTF